jgi:STE20-like kinase
MKMHAKLKDSSNSSKPTSSRHNSNTHHKEKRVSPDSYDGSNSTRCSHSDSGSTRSHTPSKSIDRSDAESISTTISQDSRGSNKETNHVGASNGSGQRSEMDEEVVLRRKPEYAREIPRRTKEDVEKIQMMNLKKKTRKRTRKFEIDGVVVTTTTSKVIFSFSFPFLLSNND